MASKSPSPADIAYEHVRTICLRFPAAEEKLSHGAPAFHVRGKLFLMFVDDYHGDGRLGVWCKSTLEEQRRLVAADSARYYVPPYVGVRGWVGVRVDQPSPDWIDLSILVEDAWRSVAPPRVVRGQAPGGAGAPPSPPVRVTTDENLAREALERLTAICLGLPEAEREREGKHAAFRVRKKTFAYFLDNHHGDGVVAACVKGDRREHAALIASHPSRFFLPPYMGPRGYLGVRLDAKGVDWDDLRARVAASYASVAPKALASRMPALPDRRETPTAPRPSSRRAGASRRRAGTRRPRAS
jgi:hypothetical protein